MNHRYHQTEYPNGIKVRRKLASDGTMIARVTYKMVRGKPVLLSSWRKGR